VENWKEIRDPVNYARLVKIWSIRFAEDPEHLVGLVSRNPVEIINVRLMINVRC